MRTAFQVINIHIQKTLPKRLVSLLSPWKFCCIPQSLLGSHCKGLPLTKGRATAQLNGKSRERHNTKMNTSTGTSKCQVADSLCLFGWPLASFTTAPLILGSLDSLATYAPGHIRRFAASHQPTHHKLLKSTIRKSGDFAMRSLHDACAVFRHQVGQNDLTGRLASCHIGILTIEQRLQPKDLDRTIRPYGAWS